MVILIILQLSAISTATSTMVKNNNFSYIFICNIYKIKREPLRSFTIQGKSNAVDGC